MNDPGQPAGDGDRGQRPPRLCIVTMGCKVNRADSAETARIAASRGFEITRSESDADLYLLNTCTVTARSDSETGRIIRRLHRTNPSAKIIVGGCLPRVSPDPDPRFMGFCTFVADRDAGGIVTAMEKSLGAPGRNDSQPAGEGTRLLGRTRPFLKIQDGCNGACTYCIVPRARGRSRSIPITEAADRVDSLIASGHMEVVLVGIHLGSYGHDLNPPATLADLLREILSRDGAGSGARVRLTSLEPLEVDGQLLEIISSSESVCRHLHVPLQSGCDRILRAMNRPYDTARYRTVVETIREMLPDACIGADVISGFPGETDADHAVTVDLIESLPLDYLHVFTFSPRPGTPAAAMRGRPASEVVKRRVSGLRELGEKKRRAFHASMSGRTLEAIIEGPAREGGASALTSNYIKVRLEETGLKRGVLADIVIDDISPDGTVRGRKA